jgi:hypothetical protein
MLYDKAKEPSPEAKQMEAPKLGLPDSKGKSNKPLFFIHFLAWVYY